MKRHRHTPEQIVRKLREGDRLLNEGKDIAEVLRHLEIAESTWNRWRAQYGGMKGRTTMKRHRHTPEQIVRKLREGDRLLNEGKDITEVVRHLEIAESTWNRWRAQYGGMKADEAKRLRQLESENARLKKLLAEAELDKAMLKELAEGNF